MEIPALKKEIVSLINKRGKITFADFMELALYHPEHGYYTSGNEKIGKKGDYYTSSDVPSVFGELIARQLEQMWRLMGKGRFTVVEMGAGKGRFCYDIINFIKRNSPNSSRRLIIK
jgi:SAM-dependent MidA family methyltransferase